MLLQCFSSPSSAAGLPQFMYAVNVQVFQRHMGSTRLAAATKEELPQHGWDSFVCWPSADGDSGRQHGEIKDCIHICCTGYLPVPCWSLAVQYLLANIATIWSCICGLALLVCYVYSYIHVLPIRLFVAHEVCHVHQQWSGALVCRDVSCFLNSL